MQNRSRPTLQTHAQEAFDERRGVEPSPEFDEELVGEFLRMCRQLFAETYGQLLKSRK